MSLSAVAETAVVGAAMLTPPTFTSMLSMGCDENGAKNPLLTPLAGVAVVCSTSYWAADASSGRSSSTTTSLEVLRSVLSSAGGASATFSSLPAWRG